MIPKPGKKDCAEFYHNYINELPDGDILSMLESQRVELLELLGDLGEEAALFRYAPGKWSVKELIGHLIDAERLFVYRAVSFSRNDPGPLPSMDENDYVKNGDFDTRNQHELLQEYDHLRQSTILFFRGLSETQLALRGRASGCEFKVGAFPWIIGGHERHHMNILKERYLKQRH